MRTVAHCFECCVCIDSLNTHSDIMREAYLLFFTNEGTEVQGGLAVGGGVEIIMQAIKMKSGRS